MWWVHPEAMGTAELVQTVRIHPWAVWGHVGCSSCGPTMDALALGRELFTANVTAVDIRGLVMHPASWEATPSPRTFQRAGGAERLKDSGRHTQQGCSLLREERKCPAEQSRRVKSRLWSLLTWIQTPFQLFLAV